MKQSGRSTDIWMRISVCTLMVAGLTVAARPQAAHDFSGRWKQDNDRRQPKRSGDVNLRIEKNGLELTVETSISRGSLSSRHAVQRHTTDGKVSVSTGADRDEFHTSVVWKDSSLVFSIEELEKSRILRSQETWSLIDHGAALQRTRERLDGEKQFLIRIPQR